MAMYTVTVRNLRTGNADSTVMRSQVTETPYALYTRAIQKLRGRGFWFHPDMPGHPNIGRVASQGPDNTTNLHERVRIDVDWM